MEAQVKMDRYPKLTKWWKRGKLESKQRSANTHLTDTLIISHWTMNGPISCVFACV